MVDLTKFFHQLRQITHKNLHTLNADMDDECSEILGRPISSLKVTELRDELAKRALTKTGNKKELIDRLRLVLQKELHSGVADLSTHPNSEQQLQEQQSQELQFSHHDQEPSGHSAIDYSSPEKFESKTSLDQTQNLHTSGQSATQAAVDFCPEATKQDLTLEQQNEDIQRQQLIEQQKLREAEEQQNELKKLEESAAQQRLKDQEERQRKLIQDEQERLKELHKEQKETEQDLSPGRASELIGNQKAKDETNSKQSTEPVDTIDAAPASDEKQPAEIEPIVPITFTLKRGISDNKDSSSATKIEKRRKWSGKTDCSQTGETSQAAALTGGISSQKLQELIDIRQAESNKSNGGKEIASDSRKEKKKSGKDDKTKKSENANQANDESSTKVASEENSKDDKVAGDAAAREASDEPTTEVESEKEPTNGLSISHLVRPFTVTQLKEELTKFGPIIDEKFWTNKVKSRCCVMFEGVEAAQKTKDTLQGQHWPSSNPKTLQIKFITQEEYDHIITYDEIKKSNAGHEKAVNGNVNKSDRKGNLDEADEFANEESKKRSGDKNSGEVNTKSSQVNRDGDNSQPQELDDLFRKTKTKPPLFYLPLNEDQAEIKQKQRKEREVRERENAARKPAQAPRRASPSRRRSPARRSPARHRSRSPRRSSPRHRSPITRRVSPRRRSPVRESPPLRRRSPIRNSPPPPPPRRRSPEPGWRSPGLVRRSPGLIRRSPGMATRRSPGPLRRSPGLSRRSPGPVRRSPGPIRRSPGPIRRSPGPMRRSPGPIKRSPGPIRRSPGPIRRSPGPTRRSPGPIRRSPGPIRRSPGPIRRSPGPVRRQPATARRSPMISRRSPIRGDSPMLARRSRSRTHSRSPLRRRSPGRRRSPMLRPVSPARNAAYAGEPRRVDRYDRMR